MGMGRRSEREGICIYIWMIYFIVQCQMLTQHCKATLPQLKKKSVQERMISAFIYITFEIVAENVKRQMYSFPRADVTNYHKLDDLK